MRENRLAKLAGLKKMAQDGSYDASYENKSIPELYEVLSKELMSLINVDESAVKTAGYYLGKSNGTEEGAIDYFRTNHPSHAGGSESLREAMDNKRSDMYDNFKQAFTKGRSEAYQAISRETAQANSQASAPTTPATSTSRSRTSGPQATTAPIKPTTIIHAVGTKLKDDSYEYKVMDQEKSFEWIDLNNRSKHGTFSLSQSGTPKWNKAVAALNALPPQTSPVAATPAAVAPAAAPAATTATTTQETSFDPALVSNVSIILSNASNKAYAPFSPGNQQQQLTTMFRAIDSAARRSGIEGVINPSQFLAKIIIAQSGPESLAGIGKIPSISSLRQGQIKRQAGQEVARLMSEVNKTYESYGGDDFKRMLISFSSKMKKVEASPPATAPTAAPATPAAATPTATGNADDGQNKSASLNKKFIKAATLRRLKIRSQMEAAIDSSAQMGRARVS